MLGVRPEHIALGFERGLRAVVEGVEYLGGDSLLTCRLGGQPLAVRAPGSVGLAAGDPTWLTWAPAPNIISRRTGRATSCRRVTRRATLMA